MVLTFSDGEREFLVENAAKGKGQHLCGGRAGSRSRQSVQEDKGCKARGNRKIKVSPEGPFNHSWLGKTIRKIAKGNWKSGLCSSSFKAGVLEDSCSMTLNVRRMLGRGTTEPFSNEWPAQSVPLVLLPCNCKVIGEMLSRKRHLTLHPGSRRVSGRRYFSPCAAGASTEGVPTTRVSSS